MSTTSKKDVQGLAKDVTAMESALNSLTYSQLADLLKEKKEKEIEAINHKLKEARGIVAALEAQLESHGVLTAPATPVKRAYTRKVKAIRNGAAKPAKATKKAKSKRGAVGEAIIKFLATKGKEGAHVKDIAAAIGNKPANVTAYFYGGAGKKLAKPLGGATFALKK